MSSIQKIVILGTGNVAWHLSKAFFKAGCDVVQVYGRSAQKAETIAAPVLASVATDLDQLIEDEDLYLLCISDDYILQVAKGLIHVKGIVAHTSGAIDLDALAPLQESGVFYPLQTFTTGQKMSYEKIPFLIEGSSGDTEAALMSLAFELSQNVYAMSSSQRQFVHVAAVFANNFSNHMLAEAKAICEENNIPFEVLHPLIKVTIHKALEGDPRDNQTGPAIRNDQKTIGKHLELLNNIDREALYQLITSSIQKNNETKL